MGEIAERRSPRGGGPFWPWSARSAVLALPVVVLGMLLVVAVLRAAVGWPNDADERIVLIGILLLALVPVVLLLLGSLAEGGSVEAFGVAIRFPDSDVKTPEVRVSASMGLQPGTPLHDSSTSMILGALTAAMGSEVATVDLEDGTAWWETRLLLLCAGGARLGRPAAVVFLATLGGVRQVFVGWASPAELLDRLLAGRDDLRRAFEWSAAQHRQSELHPPQPVTAPHPPTGPFADFNRHAVFPPDNGGHRNPLAAEQLLALELGQIELAKAQGALTTPRLQELFAPVLRTSFVDLDDPRSAGGWADTALATPDRYTALTHGRRYAGMVARDQVVTDVLRALLAATGAQGRTESSDLTPRTTARSRGAWR